MKKSQLEILSITDVKLEEVEKEYVKLGRWDSPFVKMPTKEGKFHKKMHKLITTRGKRFNADLAIIEYTNTYYPDNTASQNIIFYKKITQNL